MGTWDNQDLTTTITIASRSHTVTYHPGLKGFIVDRIVDDTTGQDVTASQKAAVEGFYKGKLESHYAVARPEAAASWDGAA